MSIAPFWYTTRLTLEWSESMIGPRMKPEVNNEREMDGHLFPILVVFCFLRLQLNLEGEPLE